MIEMHRDEEAVSAAIATVLFGGLISIISLMMVTMIPVIEELEAVLNDTAFTQMTVQSRRRYPNKEYGRCATEFVPVDGSLSWDMMRSGMWYSSTLGRPLLSNS